jgi:hypothetical protein
MTSLEMQQEFLILYDKVTNFDAPGYEPIEISIFLTKAQERVVLSLYSPLVNRVREGFEETEARRKDLQELVKGVTLSTPSIDQSNALPNGVFYNLPADFLYSVSEEVTITSNDTCLNNTRLRVKPITHDFYSINISNPWKKPSTENATWRLDYSNGKHELITDGTYTISSYHLRYIKRLRPIIIGSDIVDGVAGPTNCELNPIIHKRIVDEAVKIATGITNPEQYQIKTIEQQKGEV